MAAIPDKEAFEIKDLVTIFINIYLSLALFKLNVTNQLMYDCQK
jgi:hypothetical protein